MNYDIVEDIVFTIKNVYNGKMICEDQRADLYVYINGNEESIESVDTESIYFLNSEHNVNLCDADIQHLVYLNQALSIVSTKGDDDKYATFRLVCLNY